MAESNLQPVEGGALLDTISKMLFKGINKVFDKAAEYQEEMGVLKQISRIPFENQDGKKFTLTIKLSPVKDRNGLYYVEAESDAPDFDLSSIHEKTMELNNRNWDDFEKMLNDLFEANNFVPEEGADAEESTDTETSPEEGSLQQEGEIQDLEQQVRDEIIGTPTLAETSEGEPVSILTRLINNPKDKTCTVTCSVLDMNGDDIKRYKEESKDLDVVDEKGKTLSFAAFYNDVKQVIDDYLANNGMKRIDEGRILSSTSIQASLKCSKDNDVELVAIKASSDIKAAMDIIYDLADNDEFVEALSEEPTSFEITPNDDGYEIEEIEEIDTCDTYKDLFRAVNRAYQKLRSYRWALGPQWNADSLLDCIIWPVDELLSDCAEWVIRHCECYPYAIALPEGEGEFPSYDEFKDAKGKLDFDAIKECCITEIENLLELVEIYYVNLEHEEQSKVDGWIESAKRSLTYA